VKELGSKRIDFLDQIRALAVVPVVVSHYNEAWLPGGGIGVGIFFALSGFLISTILLEQPEPFGPRAAVRFIVRRLMRIYPAFLTAICAAVLLAYLLRPEKLPAIVGALPGVLTLTIHPAWVNFAIGVLWTLQVEMWFYMLMPVFMLLLGRRLGALVFCIVLILSSLSWYFFGRPIAGQLIWFWGPALAFGSLLALVWKSVNFRGSAARGATVCAISLSVVAGLLLFPPSTPLIWFAQVMAASLAGCGLISAFLIYPELPVARLLVWIGRISYSAYLFHAVVRDYDPSLVLGRLGHREPFAVAVYLTLVTALSVASYYLIERPGIALGGKLARLIGSAA
jgi:peptidoglycan/LPS O-acetylase OafA/YrhL